MDAAKNNSLLECSMCLDIFVDPRNLPCGHTFCFKCINKLVDSFRNKQPSCAICKAPWSVPDEGLQGLMKNFVLNNFIKSVDQQNNDLEAVVKCSLNYDGDVHGTVEYFCVDCWDPLCADCSRMHKKTKFTHNHVMKKITDITDIVNQQCKWQKEGKCSKHIGKMLEFFCNECKCAVCYVCCVTLHSRHNCVELNKMNEKFVEQIMHEIEEVKILEHSYSTHLAILEHFINDMEESYKQNLCEIKSSTLKQRQEIKKFFTLIMAKVDEYEHDSEINLSKLKNKEISYLKNIVIDIKEKIITQRKKITTREKCLLPFSSVFQKAEICALTTDEHPEEVNFNSFLEKLKLLSVLRWKYNLNFYTNCVAVKLKNSIVICELTNDTQDIVYAAGITTISVCSNKILVSRINNPSVYIYNADGTKLSDIRVSLKVLWNAVWINDEQLICTADNDDDIPILMSESGEIKTKFSIFKHGLHVYVSRNQPNIIYIADYHVGLYRSEDSGETWSLMFNVSTNNCILLQAIPVQDGYDGHVFWTRIRKNKVDLLQVCKVDKDGVTTWHEIDVVTESGENSRLCWGSMMAYDENGSIFLSSPNDNAVYVFSVHNGKQIDSLSITEGLDKPSGLAIDINKRLLYVGNKGGIIKIFEFDETTFAEFQLNRDNLSLMN